jgi:hypothetical protein
MEFWRVKYAHKYTSTIPQKPRLESAYRHTFARRGGDVDAATLVSLASSDFALAARGRHCKLRCARITLLPTTRLRRRER